MKYWHLRLTVLLLFLPVLVLPLSGCIWKLPSGSEQVANPDIEIVSLDVSPAEIIEGTPAIVTVTAVNNGEADRPYTIVLKVDEVERARKDVTIPSGAVQAMTLELVEDMAGLYTLSVDGQETILNVVGTGLLGQSLASLEGSDGKIVDLEPFEITSPYSDDVDIYKIRYLSDGLEVVGFVLKPKTDEGTYPVIIYNHGGFEESGIVDATDLKHLSLWSANGYIVVASQYRGNDGGQGKEEFGGSDVNDVLNLLPLVDSLAFASNEKIAMIGFSRGGMMAYIALAETDRIRAAAIYGGITDLFQFYSEQKPGMRQIMVDLIGGTPEQMEEEYLKRSVYYWPEKIRTPLLILHGQADETVNVTEARKLADKLHELGKPYKLVTYPGGSHSLWEDAPDRDYEIQQWFSKYLQ